MRTPSGLTDRQQRFVAEYLASGNASASYVKAGYKSKTKGAIEANASRLIGTDKVRMAVEAAQAKVLDKLEVTSERALTELARLAFFDIRKVVDDECRLIPPDKLDADIAAAITGIEIKDGQIKYRMADKVASLGHVLKVLGLLRDKVDITNTTPEPDPMELARKALFLLAKMEHEPPAVLQ